MKKMLNVLKKVGKGLLIIFGYEFICAVIRKINKVRNQKKKQNKIKKFFKNLKRRFK